MSHANSVYLDQTPLLAAAADLGTHCLPMSYL